MLSLLTVYCFPLRQWLYFHVVLSVVLAVCVRADATYQDNSIFNIQFDAKASTQRLSPDDVGIINVLTSRKEQYKCVVPRSDLRDGGDDEMYVGPSVKELVNILNEQKSCSYRIEAYWTYELCHGRFLRQFHEDKAPPGSSKAAQARAAASLQEYYLGQFSAANLIADSTKFNPTTPETRRVEGHSQELPVFGVHYDGGTACDITGQPRKATVYYACDPEARNQLQVIEETASCEYAAVVLSPTFCQHPTFQLKEQKEQEILCLGDGSFPAEPRAFTKFKREQLWHIRNQHTIVPAVLGIHGHRVAGVGKQQSETPAQAAQAHQERTTPRTHKDDYQPGDPSIVESIFQGTYCLQGGQGWWRYEYCHGRQVTQYHIDAKTKQRTNIMLGRWDLDNHLTWLEKHPSKRPDHSSTGAFNVEQVNYFYSHGDQCGETGVERQCEVRLKCRMHAASSTGVTLYLLEPETCRYVLTIESQLFCGFLDDVDDDGLFQL